MSKDEIVASIAESVNMPKTQVSKVLNATLEAIKTALANGDEVRFVGFGTFSVSERAARSGRNPHTGTQIEIAASAVPKFKPGKELKAAIKK